MGALHKIVLNTRRTLRMPYPEVEFLLLLLTNDNVSPQWATGPCLWVGCNPEF
jgi:hypothetical protein